MRSEETLFLIIDGESARRLRETERILLIPTATLNGEDASADDLSTFLVFSLLK